VVRVYDILVIMTNITRPNANSPATPRRARIASGPWVLADAKAKFSQLVRTVHREGPQRVTVHGRDEVVVIAADEFRRLKGSPSGQALIDALQASPHRKIDITATRARMPVRNVSL
jgi:prevent-host-death family protein